MIMSTPTPMPAPTPTVVGRRAAGRGAILALVLVLLAGGAVLLEAPAPVRTPLSLAAVVATATRLVGHRHRSGHPRGSRLDAALVAVGGTLVVLVVVGFVVGALGLGLGTTSWALATGIPAATALTLSWARPPLVGRRPVSSRRDDRARELLRSSPWLVGAVGVTVAALVIAWRSATGVEIAPVEMSLRSLDGARAVVVVTAEEASGPLELRTETAGGTPVSYPLFGVAAGETVTVDVVVPSSGRTTITVNNPGEAEPLRTLVVNR